MNILYAISYKVIVVVVVVFMYRKMKYCNAETSHNVVNVGNTQLAYSICILLHWQCGSVAWLLPTRNRCSIFWYITHFFLGKCPNLCTSYTSKVWGSFLPKIFILVSGSVLLWCTLSSGKYTDFLSWPDCQSPARFKDRCFLYVRLENLQLLIITDEQCCYCVLSLLCLGEEKLSENHVSWNIRKNFLLQAG